MKVVLDTCILKLASRPNFNNPAALIVKLCWDGLLECWASPAMPEECSAVLADQPELLALVQDRFQVGYPLVELDCVQHEPDNRFMECALAIDADYLVTVNTARGHFDQPAYGRSRVVTPRNLREPSDGAGDAAQTLNHPHQPTGLIYGLAPFK